MTIKILQYSSHTSDIIGSSYNDCYDYDYHYIQTDDKPVIYIYPEETSNIDIYLNADNTVSTEPKTNTTDE